MSTRRIEVYIPAEVTMEYQCEQWWDESDPAELKSSPEKKKMFRNKLTFEKYGNKKKDELSGPTQAPQEGHGPLLLVPLDSTDAASRAKHDF